MSISAENKGDLSFVKRLKETIGKKSVRSFALACGLSDTVLRQYLSGKSEPTRLPLIAIAQTGNVRIEWLVTGEGYKTESNDEENEPINNALLSLVIEIIEEHEAEMPRKINTTEKASLISLLYALCFDYDDIASIEKKELLEGLNAILAFGDFLDKLVKSEKGIEAAVRILRKAFQKTMSKEDADHCAHETVDAKILEKHMKNGTLKWLAAKKRS